MKTFAIHLPFLMTYGKRMCCILQQTKKSTSYTLWLNLTQNPCPHNAPNVMDVHEFKMIPRLQSPKWSCIFSTCKQLC